MMMRMVGMFWMAVVMALAGVRGVSAQGAPQLPVDLPLWMVGNGAIDGTRLKPYTDVAFSIGGTDKEGPLETGEQIRAAATRLMTLRADRRDGRDVWVRSFSTTRAGDPAVVAQGEIVLDRRTLAPLSSSMGQGDSMTSFEYDWQTYEIRSSSGDAESLDLLSLEAGAHEAWVGAIDWTAETRVMIPTILAGGGGKWWAVPHVTGTEDIDLGDGELRRAWVVEMDWWGMGADHDVFTPGGGPNGSAGQGGKYWVLMDPPVGVPPVVRIQTEQNGTVDRVLQIQGGG
jgi:hypothetical protein